MSLLSEKQMKERVKKEASADPDRFFPTERMREIGLERRRCPKCGTQFWTADSERTVCGEPACEGGYSFIGRKNCTHVMDFIGVWERFSELFKKRGYTPIKRYPSISRWNPTSEFTLASITDFQPYVVRGAVRPPANPLVVPQTCLRFNDVDNVGITGRHNTGFIMIGQHAFVPLEKYDQPKYFEDIHAWLVEGMGIPLKDIVYHEDAWAGGGNFGCSLEFFSKGLEIGNQVYTMYERSDDDLKGLDIRVLDMGMGQERPAWYSHGTPTAYEPNFPTVMRKLFRIGGVSEQGEEKELLTRFLPYSALLNMDEVDDVEKVWKDIAARIGADERKLREAVMVHAGLYSIADHSRALLFALTDGGLPSNSGGGYNLRLIFRRALDFIGRYGWDIDLGEVCLWHAEYLRPQFPEMLEAVPEVRKILDHEASKYRSTKDKALSTVGKLKEKEAQGRPVTVGDLLTLYDSQGITPDLIDKAGLGVKVPADFYKKVAELHEKGEPAAQTHREQKLPFGEHPPTKVLYYDDYLMLEFGSEVLRTVDGHVLLKETAFYPTSGGQLHDVGRLIGPTEVRVVEVFKQDHLIVHKVEGDLSLWRPGAAVTGLIDMARRRQLAQHHTVTHIINGVCRSILGNHIWQAGAEKTEEKGRLDITHYETLTKEELELIERRSNEIVQKAIPVESMILPRNEAEERFGFRLYQGGAVPGEELRIVRIEGLDTEACGGTHLRNTSEAVRITLTGTKKIQDGIIRLEYAAGRRAKEMYDSDLADLSFIVGVTGVQGPDKLASSLEELFLLWKRLKKLSGRPGGAMDEAAKDQLEASISEMEKGEAFRMLEHWRSLGMPMEGAKIEGALKGHDIPRPHEHLSQASDVFKVQRQHIVKTVVRFLKESDAFLSTIRDMLK